MAGKRLFEADVLKAIAIIIIVLAHAFLYFDQKITVYNAIHSAYTYIGYIGLGLFLFISGYLLYHNYPKITRQDILAFYKKRVLRIYPLYWFGIIVTIISFGYLYLYFYKSIDFSTGNIIIHFLGIQSLTQMDFISYWFIGIILAYYLLYPVIIGVSNKTINIVLLSLCITGILMFAYVVLHIDNHLFSYLMVFIAGVIACKIGVFEQGKIEKYVPLITVCLLAAIISNVLLTNEFNVHGLILNETISFLSFVTRDMMMISSSLLFFWVVRKYGSYNLSKKLFLPQISYGSYATYLLEPICFAIIYAIAQSLGINGHLLNGVILIIGLPMAIAVGYYIQTIEDKLIRILNDQIMLVPRKTNGI